MWDFFLMNEETVVRKLWSKVKVKSPMADLKVGSIELMEASHGKLFGKRFLIGRD